MQKSFAIMRRLTKAKVLDKLYEEDATAAPPPSSPLYKEMIKSDHKNSETKFNARASLSLMLVDTARKLANQTEPVASAFFTMADSLLNVCYGPKNASGTMTTIRKATPAPYKKFAYTLMTMPEEETKAEGKAYAEKTIEDQKNTIPFDVKSVFDIQTELLNSDNKFKWVLAAILACGARFIEVVNPIYKFEAAPDSKNEIIQTGVAKGWSIKKTGADGKEDDESQQERNLQKTVQKPIIGEPTHINVEKFLALLKKIRKNFKTAGRTNKQITASYNGTLNKHVVRAFDGFDSGAIGHTSHMCRKMYATIAIELYKPDGVSPSSYAARILGHDGLNTQFIYTRFEIKRRTAADQTATVARLESKVEELQSTVSDIKEENKATSSSEAHLLRREPHSRDGDAAKLDRLKERIAELQAAGRRPTVALLKTLGFGSRVISALRSA